MLIVTIALPQETASAGLVPGQRVWVRIPGQTTSLMQVLKHWCTSRWQQMQRDTKQPME